MAFPMADMAIFDQKTCKKICATKIKIGKKLAACQNFEFKICCDAKLPPVYIIYVRVHHTFGSSEQWFFSN